MNSVEFNLKKRFFTKFGKFSAKFWSLNVQIINNFQNIVFIACKCSNICKYYVNSMVISCSTCQKKENNAHGLNIWFTLFCRIFKFIVIYAFFLPNWYSQNFRVHKKKWFFQVWLNARLLFGVACSVCLGHHGDIFVIQFTNIWQKYKHEKSFFF